MRTVRLFLSLLCSLTAVTALAQLPDGHPLTGLDQLRPGRSRRSSSADPNWQDGNGDARPIPPGQTLTIAELQGPGRIQHIWFTVASPDPYYGRSMTLRMYWDGREEPAVECPLGDFFAVGHGMQTPLNSMPVQISSEGRAYNCYWPMPFRESARITVSNDSLEYPVQALFWYVDWTELPDLSPDSAYFHAQYRQEFPCTPGNYLIFEGKGRGHYVGTVLSVHANEASWFGEGDDFFYIDGEEEPSLRGTGTEDYFCDAWGFRHFNNPFYGVSVWEGYEADDRGTVYRWHIPDPVCFEQSLRVTIEHKGVTFHSNDEIRSYFEERPDHFSSVAYWYQVGEPLRFAEIPPAAERVVAHHLIEVETLIDEVLVDAPEFLQDQPIGNASGGRQLLYHPGPDVETPRIGVPFTVPESGEYAVRVNLARSWDYGVFRILLNDREVMTGVDLYHDTVIFEAEKLGRQVLEAGEQLLTFEYTQSNPSSRVRGTGEVGRYIGIDSIAFRLLPPRPAPPPELE
jgi:hypothetical protein